MEVERVLKAGGLSKLSSISDKIKELDMPLERNKKSFEKINNRKNINDLDKPLNSKETTNIENKALKDKNNHNISTLDKPINIQKIEKIERLEPPVEIRFKCPENMDRKEFIRQIKGQERGINSQSVFENMRNREMYEIKGRDLNEGKKAQVIARQKALTQRINSNQKKGMSYSEAKIEAENWIKGQAALHNPDQIAGGDPLKVSRMGDASVNSSIGRQWRDKVGELKKQVDDFATGKTTEQLKNTKMNVRLIVI